MSTQPRKYPCLFTKNGHKKRPLWIDGEIIESSSTPGLFSLFNTESACFEGNGRDFKPKGKINVESPQFPRDYFDGSQFYFSGVLAYLDCDNDPNIHQNSSIVVSNCDANPSPTPPNSIQTQDTFEKNPKLPSVRAKRPFLSQIGPLRSKIRSSVSKSGFISPSRPMTSSVSSSRYQSQSIDNVQNDGKTSKVKVFDSLNTCSRFKIAQNQWSFHQPQSAEYLVSQNPLVDLFHNNQSFKNTSSVVENRKINQSKNDHYVENVSLSANNSSKSFSTTSFPQSLTSLESLDSPDSPDSPGFQKLQKSHIPFSQCETVIPSTPPDS